MKIKILGIFLFFALFLVNANSVSANSCTSAGGTCQNSYTCSNGTSSLGNTASKDCESAPLNYGICCTVSGGNTTNSQTNTESSGSSGTSPCIAQNGNCTDVCSDNQDQITASDCGTLKCCRTKGAAVIPPGTNNTNVADCDAVNGACYTGSKCPSGMDLVSSTMKECAQPDNTQGLCCRNADASSNPNIATPNSGSTQFANPLGNVTSISQVVGNLLDNLRGVLGAIAIVMIVVGGIMYILSAGNEKTITRAKGTITAAVVGLALAFAAPSFLKEIQSVLGGVSSSNPDQMVNQALTLKQIAMNTLGTLLSIIGILGIIGLVIGGAFYLTAYGDEKRIEKGKTIITSSIIGIAIALAALVIVKQIASLMGIPQ